MAEEHRIDLVTIHPAVVLGTVYYPNESPVSIQVVKVRRMSCRRQLLHAQHMLSLLSQLLVPRLAWVWARVWFLRPGMHASCQPDAHPISLQNAPHQALIPCPSPHQVQHCSVQFCPTGAT